MNQVNLEGTTFSINLFVYSKTGPTNLNTLSMWQKTFPPGIQFPNLFLEDIDKNNLEVRDYGKKKQKVKD